MQFKILAGFIIFLGSYLPLAIILAVQDIPIAWWGNPLCDLSKIDECMYNPFEHPYLSVIFIFVTIISVIISNITLNEVDLPFDGEVKSSKSIPNDIINYVFPYVVSFMGISYDSPEKMLGFVVFLLWMFAITYKSGQIVMNPLLLMFGWKLYEAKIIINGNERDVRVLKKGSLSPGYYKFQSIQDFYISKEFN